MMWFFLMTDALTFSGLAAYGFSRFKYVDIWPVPEEVFTLPFFTWRPPFTFVALMTFILI